MRRSTVEERCVRACQRRFQISLGRWRNSRMHPLLYAQKATSRIWPMKWEQALGRKHRNVRRQGEKHAAAPEVEILPPPSLTSSSWVGARKGTHICAEPIIALSAVDIHAVILAQVTALAHTGHTLKQFPQPQGPPACKSSLRDLPRPGEGASRL